MPSNGSSAEQLEAGLYNSEKHMPARRKKPYLYAALLLLALVIIGGAVGLAVARLSGDDPAVPAAPPPPPPAPVVEETAPGTPAVAPQAAPEPVAEPAAQPVLGPPNTWQMLKSTPFPIGEVSAGVLTFGAKPYLVVVGEHPKGDANNGVTLIYDITGQQFITAGVRPEIGNHHASEVVNNKMYLLGGLGGGEGAVQIGELVAGAGGGVGIKWTKGAPLPTPSGSAASALLGNKIVYCGGIDKANTQTLDMCMTYDVASNTWDAASPPPMPVGRNHAATCTDGTTVWVFGGRSGKNVVGEGFGETQILSGGAWSQGTPMKFGRGGMGKAVYSGGKCYVFGGEVWPQAPAPDKANFVDAQRTVYSVDIYDTATDTWSYGKEMPKGLHGIFPVKYQGVVYVTGGGTKAAYSQSMANYAYVL